MGREGGECRLKRVVYKATFTKRGCISPGDVTDCVAGLHGLALADILVGTSDGIGTAAVGLRLRKSTTRESAPDTSGQTCRKRLGRHLVLDISHLQTASKD
eukprot:2482450-Rhodomonas_salina.1